MIVRRRQASLGFLPNDLPGFIAEDALSGRVPVNNLALVVQQQYRILGGIADGAEGFLAVVQRLLGALAQSDIEGITDHALRRAVFIA